MLKSNSDYSELKKIKDREGIHILYAIRNKRLIYRAEYSFPGRVDMYKRSTGFQLNDSRKNIYLCSSDKILNI